MVANQDLLPESCQACGACCFGDGPRYLRVSGSDHSRLADDGSALTQFVGNRCYMRLVDGHCIALTIGTGTPRFACQTYETRPEPCRQLERGSPQCLAEHARKHGRTGRSTGPR